MFVIYTTFWVLYAWIICEWSFHVVQLPHSKWRWTNCEPPEAGSSVLIPCDTKLPKLPTKWKWLSLLPNLGTAELLVIAPFSVVLERRRETRAYEPWLDQNDDSAVYCNSKLLYPKPSSSLNNNGQIDEIKMTNWLDSHNNLMINS